MLNADVTNADCMVILFYSLDNRGICFVHKKQTGHRILRWPVRVMRKPTAYQSGFCSRFGFFILSV